LIETLLKLNFDFYLKAIKMRNPIVAHDRDIANIQKIKTYINLKGKSVGTGKNNLVSEILTAEDNLTGSFVDNKKLNFSDTDILEEHGFTVLDMREINLKL